jgi:hypothetical protein
MEGLLTVTSGGERPGDESVLVEQLEHPAPGEFVDHFREMMRGAVALGLLLLLLIEIVLGTYLVWKFATSDKPDNAKILTDWLTSVITGTMALLGAATGFYYGNRS